MRLLISTLALAATVFAASSSPIRYPLQCDDGWTRIGESCYWFSNRRLSTYDASFDCETNQQAKLFVTNSLKEFNAVFKSAPHETYIWTGLQKNHQGMIWGDVENTIAYQKLDWLNKPYDDAANGWTIFTQCAAHFTSSDYKSFIHYFQCNLPFHYICERNFHPEPVV